MSSSVYSAFFGLLARDAVGLWRQRSEMLNPLLFMLTVATLFPLALGPETGKLSPVANGLCWVIVLLANLLSLDNLFRSDLEDGSLDIMLISHKPLTILVTAKIVLHWLTTALPLLILAPFLAKTLGMPAIGNNTLMLALLLATPQISVLGACAAALTSSLRSSSILLSLIVLPLMVPILIFGAGAVETVLIGGNPAQPLLLLAAGAIVSMTFGPYICSSALRMSAS